MKAKENEDVHGAMNTVNHCYAIYQGIKDMSSAGSMTGKGHGTGRGFNCYRLETDSEY